MSTKTKASLSNVYYSYFEKITSYYSAYFGNFSLMLYRATVRLKLRQKKNENFGLFYEYLKTQWKNVGPQGNDEYSDH